MTYHAVPCNFNWQIMLPLSARDDKRRENRCGEREMNEDHSSRWEISPLCTRKNRRLGKGSIIEKIVLYNQSVRTRVESPFCILVDEPGTGSTGNAARWSKRSEHYAPSMGNRTLDIVFDPAARDDSRDCNEATAYYFHSGGRFGKFLFALLR